MPAGPRRICALCRRDEVIAQVNAYLAPVGPSLDLGQVTAAVDAVATNHARWRSLATALRDNPAALATGAPPVIGALVSELIARGASGLSAPTCVICRRGGRALTATDDGGMCGRCAARRNPAVCAQCGLVKPVAGRTEHGAPICEACRRHRRGQRPCGVCGKTASIAVRARQNSPQICVNCYRLPTAVCHRCGRQRPCQSATTDRPTCRGCTPRAKAVCARCGQDRPPTARWDEGPVCDPCYTAALRQHGPCSSCGAHRRLVAPPGRQASICADCAGMAITHACAECGLEDKLYERNRCAPCSLRHRAADLLSAGVGDVPEALSGVFEAICAARNPRTALNWLRNGAGAAILADLANGQIPATHVALDAHPRRRAADYLRQMLIAGGALPPRNEQLARVEHWLTALLEGIDDQHHRRLVRTFATWQVMHRLHRGAQTHPTPRTYTARARLAITTTARFLAWLSARNIPLADCRQADIDQWLTTRPTACHIREFLTWAAEHDHCRALSIPGPPRHTGTMINSNRRWELTARLLHDEDIELVDRVAGCLLLLFGQQQSRIAVITIDQISYRDTEVFIRFGQHDVPLPPPLGELVRQLATQGKSHVGIGSPPVTRWLFPGGMPGQPITASRLADRLRTLGIPTQASRRAALTDLAAQLPAAVLADLLNLHPTTAVKWMHQAGGDWTRYAAELVQTHDHQPCE